MTAQEELVFLEVDIFLGRLTPMLVYEKMKERIVQLEQDHEEEVEDKQGMWETIFDEHRDEIRGLEEEIEELKKELAKLKKERQ